MPKVRNTIWFRGEESINKARDYVYEKWGTLHTKLGEFLSDCIDF